MNYQPEGDGCYVQQKFTSLIEVHIKKLMQNSTASGTYSQICTESQNFFPQWYQERHLLLAN